MKNAYFYLFYKLTQVLNKKGNNESGPVFGISIFTACNLSFVYRKVLPVTKENFEGIYKYSYIVLLVSIYIINTILFYNKKRVSRILERYRKESLTNARIGSLLVILYILVSLGLLFL